MYNDYHIMCEFRLSRRCKLDLQSFEMLRSVG